MQRQKRDFAIILDRTLALASALLASGFLKLDDDDGVSLPPSVPARLAPALFAATPPGDGLLTPGLEPKGPEGGLPWGGTGEVVLEFGRLLMALFGMRGTRSFSSSVG